MARARTAGAAEAVPAPKPTLLGVPDLASADTRRAGWVSPWSRWPDPRWYFADPARPGHHHAAAVWDFLLEDGSSFLEARFDDLRESASSWSTASTASRPCGHP